MLEEVLQTQLHEAGLMLKPMMFKTALCLWYIVSSETDPSLLHSKTVLCL